MFPSLDFICRFTLFAIVHSLLASNRSKAYLTQSNSRRKNWYRLGYNALSMVMFIWVMAGWPTAPVLYVVPGTGYLALRGIQLLLLVIAVRCLLQTGLAEFLGFSPQCDSAPLTTSGCYAKVRHPLYTLTVLFLLCEPAPSSKWLLLTLLTALYCGLASRWEESRLLQQFGESYLRYQTTVPAFIPRVRKLP